MVYKIEQISCMLEEAQPATRGVIAKLWHLEQRPVLVHTEGVTEVHRGQEVSLPLENRVGGQNGTGMTGMGWVVLGLSQIRWKRMGWDRRTQREAVDTAKRWDGVV